ncbi:tetratricopeptide repeat protein, partial [Candidatus Poribacteria bacterium]|nr:tetratricopeptide repeat protein [Candidatus Poribacteria bacterium]
MLSLLLNYLCCRGGKTMLPSNLNRSAPDAASIRLNRYTNSYNRNDVGVNDPKDISTFNKDNIGVNDASIYNYRGIDCCEKGKFDEGIEHFNRVIALVPKFAAAYYNRGVAYFNKGDFDNAISDYTKAIEFKPDYAETYYSRGNAYTQKGDFDNALEDYNIAIKL